MTDRDGLYLNDTLVDLADGIATTYQGNDLTKPASLQTNFSQSFDLADSMLMRKLTKNAEQLDSGSPIPYQQLTALIIAGGERIFEGIAELNSFSAGWEVALYEEKRALFDRLDRSLKTLDLARYNHPWTVEQINARAEAVDGVCYPLIDYGLLQNDELPIDSIFPAVFIKTIIAQALHEEGYRLVGSLPDDTLYQRLLLPFSESEPTSYDEQWKTDRSARVTMDQPTDTVDRGTLSRGQFLNRIQSFNLDNLDTFGQGKLHNYNTTTFSYVPDTAMNLKVEAAQIFKALCVNGGVEVILSVEKNGNQVANSRFEAGSGYNLMFARSDKLTLSQTIKCKAGDRIQIRLEARRFTDIGAFRFEIYNDPDTAFVSFTPQLTTAFGDQWLIARNLPDVSIKSLLINIAFLFCGNWQVNRRRKEVSFSRLSDIVQNTANANDWSNRLDTSIEPTWTPRLDPYAQNNLLAWKETDETKAAGIVRGSTILNYGDGILNVNASVLDAETTLFEMTFAASTESSQSLAGYGNPILIKTRSVSGRGENLSISNQAAIPRLILASLDQSFPVQSSILLDDSVTSQPVTMNLKACWFGKRPDIAISNDTAFCLSFNPVPVNHGEMCLIDLNYEGLQRVLRRMRVLKVSMRLKPTDIANLDFGRPIRLQGVQVGASIILSDGYYYLNRIADYESGRPCSVTLVAY